ncbi:restriction endonuclease subunit S, partial [Planktomarina temperata]|nr:restriction endonuclease subunit S [Planktomarina temperata]
MKAGWEVKTLGDAFQTVTGSTPPKARKDYYGNDVPLVKPPELIDNLVSDAVDGLTSEGSKVARIAPAGSILVSCIGNLGKIGLAARDLAFNQQINAIFPNNTKAISEFMFYQVLSPQFKSQIEALATGTTVPIVNKSRFNSITVNLPPLEEQKRIVSILDEAFEGLDRARENAEANLKSARELFHRSVERQFEALASIGN